ncbi:MAG: nuclear transport factor 2 family protein [Flavobacteriales bacterium]|jgi:ketosteroid isomerase-like protein|nr:nuclear transport factor 2 family protein [Flavobacteriales bacterium]
MQVLERFYTAFSQRDWATMGACYHSDARFSDPVFTDLDAAGVRSMWRMLLTSGTDLRITFRVLEESATGGRVRWEAWYTFSRTKRPVHNVIAAEFTLKDGLILVHQDRFDLWRWSRQALGLPGLLLGWSPIIANKVRATAAQALSKQRHQFPD